MTNKPSENNFPDESSNYPSRISKESTNSLPSKELNGIEHIHQVMKRYAQGWESIEGLILGGFNDRLEKIPETQRKEPPLEIAVPLVQALTYTAQNETLREMYLSLLASSMDKGKDRVVHPSFVNIIKQMNSLDARVFDKLCASNDYQPALNPQVAIKRIGKNFIGSMPEWFIGWRFSDATVFDISASLVRLSKFGLIDLLFDRTAGNDTSGVEHLKAHQELSNILDNYKAKHPDLELEIFTTLSLVYVNEYGHHFRDACK